MSQITGPQLKTETKKHGVPQIPFLHHFGRYQRYAADFTLYFSFLDEARGFAYRVSNNLNTSDDLHYNWREFLTHTLALSKYLRGSNLRLLVCKSRSFFTELESVGKKTKSHCVVQYTIDPFFFFLACRAASRHKNSQNL